MFTQAIQNRLWLAVCLSALLPVIAVADPQPPPDGPGRDGRGPAGRGPGGRGPGGQGQSGDPAFVADRTLFHTLLTHRDQIRREVWRTEQGVETLTESDNPEIAAAIQKHVASMEKRVKQGRPIHRRDPLFAALFRRSDKIGFEVERTDRGVRVTESSDDPYTIQLIQAHAEVVSSFLKYGFPEVRRNHSPPPEPAPAEER